MKYLVICHSFGFCRLYRISILCAQIVSFVVNKINELHALLDKRRRETADQITLAEIPVVAQNPTFEKQQVEKKIACLL